MVPGRPPAPSAMEVHRPSAPGQEVLAQVQRRLLEREESLSPFAARSRLSRGRERPEEPSPLRGEFQRDRDRIIHSKAFRRLKHKTQVFIAPGGDHFVTRLTHTLEVAQIARTIARALDLNEDLTEAIALGHDLGHPPFGHAGEETLAELVPGGFRHAEQGLRVVERLEKGGRGLNLTWEVRNGILYSSKPRDDILGEGLGTPATLEGQVVKIADAVAYLNHDIADAIRAGLLSEDDLPAIVQERLGRSHSQRIDTMVRDIVAASWAATGRLGTRVQPRIIMSPPVHEAANELREFMFRRVYQWEGRRQEAERAKRVVRFLYLHFRDHPEQIQSDYVIPDDPPWRQAADYVSGMTDRFALDMAYRLGYRD